MDAASVLSALLPLKKMRISPSPAKKCSSGWFRGGLRPAGMMNFKPQIADQLGCTERKVERKLQLIRHLEDEIAEWTK
jgi:hypothetical protein